MGDDWPARYADFEACPGNVPTAFRLRGEVEASR